MHAASLGMCSIKHETCLIKGRSSDAQESKQKKIIVYFFSNDKV